jgi:hypothetical protein
MRLRSALLLAALAATALFTVAVAGASANRLRILNGERGFRIVWSPMTFSINTGAVIRCPATLEGTFHSSSFTKTAGSLLGFVTRAVLATERCTGGSATFLTETLPWHVQYGSFSGTLPRIASVRVRLIGLSTNLEDGAYACLSRTTAEHPGGFILNTRAEARGLLELPTVAWDETLEIPLTGGILCLLGVSWGYSGVGNLTVQGETATPKLALI